MTIPLRPPIGTILLLFIAGFTPALSQTFQGVLTSRNTSTRAGQNRQETILTPQNVTFSGFGKIFSYTVDGQIYAQPLYVPNVSIPGQGTRNVVYVVTQMDSVYAFDADGHGGTALWQDSFIDLAQGIEPVPCGIADCSVYPYHGINGTPVIDPNTNTMYLVARTYNVSTKQGFQYLHALDITTGVEKFGGPVSISGFVPGAGMDSSRGMVKFNPLTSIQRPGLLLLKGKVYIGWTSPSHGWIMAYDAGTLEQTAIFTTTPNAVRGGVWQSGNGLAADSSGYIYAASGDGLFDVDSGGLDYGDTVIKMDASLNVVDYFTPMDQACRLQVDMDLGSSGPVVLPTKGNISELVTSGKGGRGCDPSVTAPIYLLDRGNLGKYNPMKDHIIQEISGAGRGYWSSPAYWQAGDAYLYYAGRDDSLKMYILKNGRLSEPVAQSANLFPIGATPSVSSNGGTGGIVWAVERQEGLGDLPGSLPAILYAYDAGNVSVTLYDSSQNVQRDQGGCADKFQVPTIANGKVYVSTQNELDVFGLIAGVPAPGVFLSIPCYTYANQMVGTTSEPMLLGVTNAGTAKLNIDSIAVTGMNAADFAQTNNCPAVLQVRDACTISITFTPSALGPRAAQVIVTDDAPGSPQNTYLTGVGTN
jgi:hypothetical protein